MRSVDFHINWAACKEIRLSFLKHMLELYTLIIFRYPGSRVGNKVVLLVKFFVGFFFFALILKMYSPILMLCLLT